MTDTTCIEWAARWGSRATTHRAAVRYIRSHLAERVDRPVLPPWPSWHGNSWPYHEPIGAPERTYLPDAPAWYRRYLASDASRPRRGYIVPDPLPARQRWLLSRHAERRDRWYDRLASDRAESLGLRPIDAKRERARVRRLARRREIEAARQSAEERELIAAGYSLSREGHHRILAGMDDGSPFEVRVPLRCQTIGEALNWLRPDGVPEDAPRQGEWFFVPAVPESEGVSDTPAGSYREVEHLEIPTFDDARRHMPDECIAVVAHGETVFMGRHGLASHGWQARPHIYVRGKVTHPEHGALTLDGWHEVVPNRAHGPFRVGRLGGGLD